MRLVITGGSGYIGRRLVGLALQRRYTVVLASRRQPPLGGMDWIPYDLKSETSFELPAGTDAVVHLAANTTMEAGVAPEREIQAARQLIAAAQKVGARVIFVSSQAARQDAPTKYGQIKWRIEQDVLAAGGWVVRPGMVYGGGERGLFGVLVKAVRRLPLLPAFLPAPKVQPIHVDDLAEGLLKILEQDVQPGVICLASPGPVTFTHFLSSIACGRLRIRRWFFPVPVPLVSIVGALIGEYLREKSGLERLRSLFELPLMNTAGDLAKLQLALRPLESGMHASGNDERRRMLCEGYVLFGYIMKCRPGKWLLRRYVRSMEKLRKTESMNLPLWLTRFPVALALFDARSFCSTHAGVELLFRLDVATTLVEATPQGAWRFLGIGRKSGAVISLLVIFNAVIGEAFWRALRLASYPLLLGWLRRNGNSQ